MIYLLLVLVVATPPTLHYVPPEARLYLPLLRGEPGFVCWYYQHRESTTPITDYINDVTVPARDRQRAWQFRKKLRN